MANHSGTLKAKTRLTRQSPLAVRASSATRNFRRGLTLIELLVSIVILVTVLGAVIPVISPNNDARRIRQGARQIQSMFVQAQSLAAREGRPYGIAFRETGTDADGDGDYDDLDGDGNIDGDATALEAYFISEPKPYTGFSEYSRVRLLPRGADPNDPVLMQFVLAGPPTGQPFPNDLVDDQFPPNLIRRGARIEVGGVVYRMIDPDQFGDDNPVDQPDEEIDFPKGEFYTLQNLKPNQTWLCVPETLHPPLPVHVPAGGPIATNPLPYKFLRQASSLATRPGNSAEPPLQLPRGVGIDLAASGLDVIFPNPSLALSPQFSFTSMQSALQTQLNANPWPFLRPLSVDVMFAPSGRLEGIWVNGEKLQGSPDRLYLLLGRAENSVRPGSEKLADCDFNSTDVPSDADGDATVLERRQRVNWLNGDSLWVTVSAPTGRIVTSDVDISTDPRVYYNDTPLVQAAKQIRDSRQFAREMTNPTRQ